MFYNFEYFSRSVLNMRAEIHKMPVRIANWEDPGQTVCGYALFI